MTTTVITILVPIAIAAAFYMFFKPKSTGARVEDRTEPDAR